MGKINQDLLQAIADRKGISPKAVYPQVTKVVQETFLERELAALVLASKSGININKYSTAAQRADIRGYLTGGGRAQAGQVDAVPASQAQAAARSPAKKKLGKKPTKTVANSVFVVHGRDDRLRASMFEFLRALGLNPMEWSHAVASVRNNANPYVGDILDAAMAKVQAVVVLFSPDELAYLKEQFWATDDKKGDGQPSGQARPNVIFEAGLALGRHPEKTVIVQVGKVRPFSDLAGKHIVRLGNEVAKRNEFANRLDGIGCTVDKVGNDWMTAGHFEPTPPLASTRKKAHAKA